MKGGRGGASKEKRDFAIGDERGLYECETTTSDDGIEEKGLERWAIERTGEGNGKEKLRKRSSYA